MINMAENEAQTPGLPPFQITSAYLHSLPPGTTCTAMVLPTPSLNASCTLITGGTTYSECNEVKCLSGADAFIDEIGAELMYVTLAYIVTMVVMCSVHRRVSCNAVTAAPTVVSAPLSNIQAPIPSKVVEISEDSGYAEGVSTTRGDNSSCESNNGDPSDQTNTSNISVNVEASDDNQHLPSSRKESDHSKGATQFVRQTTGIPPRDHPPAPLKEKMQGTGTSATKQQETTAAPPRAVLVLPNPARNASGTWGEETDEGGGHSVPSSVHPPHPESDGTLAEETDEGGGRNISSSVRPAHLESDDTWAEVTGDQNEDLNFASAEPSDSDASWAEETRKEHRDITSPHENSQDETEGDSPGATTSSVGELSPEGPMHLDEPNVAMVLADPVPFPGGGLFIVQMFVMEPQPPLQAEPWPMHLPEEESEEGRNGPSQLVP